MKTIYIRGGAAANTSVKVLTKHFERIGHKVVRDKHEPYDVVLGWGSSRQEVVGPMLNAGVNQFNKFEAIRQFHSKAIPAPIVLEPRHCHYRAYGVGGHPLPWLARKFVHKCGKDIKVCKTFLEAQNTVCDFFSVYIPTQTEYRVWTFKGKAFAAYEKLYKGEGEYQGFLRNHRFGFKFEKRDDMLGDEALTNYSVKAVKSLGMDFGAVDVILSKDNEYYVLEVNSMPNIDSVDKSSGLRLAKMVSQWAEGQ